MDEEVQELVGYIAESLRNTVRMESRCIHESPISIYKDRAKQILSRPKLALMVKCERCAGRGVFHSERYECREDKPITCSQCHGTGIIPIPLAEALRRQEVKDEEWSAEFDEYTPPWRETKDG